MVRGVWRSGALLVSWVIFSACPFPSSNHEGDYQPPDLEAWNLTTAVVGSGGVTRSPAKSSYPDGSDVLLTAVPAADWAFLEWSGDVSGHDNPVTLTMTANVAVTATFYELVWRGTSAAACRLSGTPNVGELWTVDCAGSEYPHTVSDFETLPQVAAGLALLLDVLDGVTAGAEGSMVVCASLGGGPPDIDLSVTSPARATVDGATATTKLVHFAGMATQGEVWSIHLEEAAFSHTVAGGESLGDVAAALAVAIEAADDYLAEPDGTAVVVSKVSGGAFSLTTTAPAGGTATVDESTPTTKSVVLSDPSNAGDTWSVYLAGGVSSYVVQVGDTLSEVAAILSAQLESVSGFSVGSEERRIVVASVAGGTFELAAAVTPSGAGTVDRATPTAVVIAPSGPVVAGGTWTLSLNGMQFLYTVQAGDSAQSLAAELAALVDTVPGYIAAGEGAVFTITRIAGGDLSADLIVNQP